MSKSTSQVPNRANKLQHRASETRGEIYLPYATPYNGIFRLNQFVLLLNFERKLVLSKNIIYITLILKIDITDEGTATVIVSPPISLFSPWLRFCQYQTACAQLEALGFYK